MKKSSLFHPSEMFPKKGSIERPVFFFIILFFLSMSILIYLNAWEWGILDDPGLASSCLSSQLTSTSWIQGFFKNLGVLYFQDIHWGLFRPSYWVYSSVVYCWSPAWGYWGRALLLCGILFASAALFTQVIRESALKVSSKSCWIFLLALGSLFAQKSLYEGLGLISLQEFSGLFFAIIASLVWGFSLTNLRKRAPLLILAGGFLYTVAIGFKSPFIWLALCVEMATLLSPKTSNASKKLAVVFLLLHTVLLYKIIAWASHGTYTNQIYLFEIERFLETIKHFIRHSFLGFLGVAALFFFYRPKWSSLKKLSSQTPLSLFFLAHTIGGCIYLANLLPRGVSYGFGYYFGPPIFLITLGLSGFILSFAEYRAQSSKLLAWAGSSFVMFSILLLGIGVHTFHVRNQAIIAIKEWALQLPMGSVVGVNSNEVASRLTQILALRSSTIIEIKKVNEHVSFVPQRQWPYQFLIVFKDQEKPVHTFKNSILKTEGVEVFKVD